jgi:glutaminyl-peptide cyclotransferase
MKKICRLMILFFLSAAGCSTPARTFSGDAALEDAREFLAFGPRVTGTEGSRQAGDWILDQLRESGWETFTDEGEYLATPVRNLASKKGEGPIILLGAHYDSRRCADMPSGGCPRPVLGANDGASGVAVLLELARTLDLDWENRQVWLVFFDAEDNGGLDGWDWIAGSRRFASLVEGRMQTGERFRAMVLVDLVGAPGQVFLRETGSDAGLQMAVWDEAAEQGEASFFSEQALGSMIDDHVPFRALGIPSLDIIGWPYAYWHTDADSFDKLDPASLGRVGRTLEAWLEAGAGF